MSFWYCWVKLQQCASHCFTAGWSREQQCTWLCYIVRLKLQALHHYLVLLVICLFLYGCCCCCCCCCSCCWGKSQQFAPFFFILLYCWITLQQCRSPWCTVGWWGGNAYLTIVPLGDVNAKYTTLLYLWVRLKQCPGIYGMWCYCNAHFLVLFNVVTATRMSVVLSSDVKYTFLLNCC